MKTNTASVTVRLRLPVAVLSEARATATAAGVPFHDYVAELVHCAVAADRCRHAAPGPPVAPEAVDVTP